MANVINLSFTQWTVRILGLHRIFPRELSSSENRNLSSRIFRLCDAGVSLPFSEAAIPKVRHSVKVECVVSFRVSLVCNISRPTVSSSSKTGLWQSFGIVNPNCKAMTSTAGRWFRFHRTGGGWHNGWFSRTVTRRDVVTGRFHILHHDVEWYCHETLRPNACHYSNDSRIKLYWGCYG